MKRAAKRQTARSQLRDHDLQEVTRAFMNDDVYARSKSTMSDFKSVMTPAT